MNKACIICQQPVTPPYYSLNKRTDTNSKITDNTHVYTQRLAGGLHNVPHNNTLTPSTQAGEIPGVGD